MIELRRRYSDINGGGGNTDIEYETAIEVTGGSINTDWIPQAGAIVKWDMKMLPNEINFDISKSLFFETYPQEDVNHFSFSSNTGGAGIIQVGSVYNWLHQSYGNGGLIKTGTMPWSDVVTGSLIYPRYTWEWNSLDGYVRFTDLEDLGQPIPSQNEWEIQKKTSTSGYPLQLFAGRLATRVIIYGIKLINQESKGGQTYTLRPARKEGVAGLYCEETGVFWSSDNGVEFTIYQE